MKIGQIYLEIFLDMKEYFAWVGLWTVITIIIGQMKILVLSEKNFLIDLSMVLNEFKLDY